MTLTEMLTQAFDEISDSSDKAKRIVTAGMNRGLTRLRAKLKRTYTIETKKFNLVDGQSKYQAPEDIIRGGDIHVTIDGRRTKVTRVHDPNEWDTMAAEASEAERPEFVFWHSSDVFEFYPAPSGNVTNGASIRYQAKARPLSQDDYTDGTVALTNGSATVTGTSTTFTVDMIGRYLKLADGNTHLEYYRIIDVASATELTLENHWGGATVSGKSYKIGEQPNLPSEYHLSLIDMGIARYYLHRKDAKLAKEYADNFTVDNLQAEEDYSSNDTSNVIESKHVATRQRKFNPLLDVEEID